MIVNICHKNNTLITLSSVARPVRAFFAIFLAPNCIYNNYIYNLNKLNLQARRLECSDPYNPIFGSRGLYIGRLLLESHNSSSIPTYHAQ